MITFKEHNKIHAWRDNCVLDLVTQGEGAVKYLYFTLIDDNGVVDLTNATQVIYYAKKPDRFEIFNDMTPIKGSSFGSDGRVKLEITAQMAAVAGIVKGEIRVVTTTGCLKFYGINLKIKEGCSDNGIESSNEFTALTSALNKIALITPEGTIKLDDTLTDEGTNAVVGKAIKQYADETLQKCESLSNKINNFDITFADESNTKYPTVRAIMEYLANYFYDVDEMDANFLSTDAKIGTKNLENKSVTMEKLAQAVLDLIDGKISNNAGAIGTDNLASSSVTTDKLANNAVTNRKIADGAISLEKITPAYVDDVPSKVSPFYGNCLVKSGGVYDALAEKLDTKDGSVQEANLDSNSVTENKIADGSVTTSKIKNSSVTVDKLASNAVVTDKLADLAVTSAKIANGAVTNAKLVDGAIANISKFKSTLLDVNPRFSSMNLIYSGGVYNALQTKYDASNIETGVGTLTGVAGSTGDSGTFTYMRIGSIVVLNATLSFKLQEEGDTKYARFSGLPYKPALTSGLFNWISNKNRTGRIYAADWNQLIVTLENGLTPLEDEKVNAITITYFI